MGAIRDAQTVSKAQAKVRGKLVRHFNVTCCLCSKDGSCIVGPRFRCIHCKSFNVCLKCEPELLEKHNPEHVFEVLLESEFDWGRQGAELPVGTRARVAAWRPGCPSESIARKLEGICGIVKGLKRGRYELELEDGTRKRVALELVEPLVTQKQAEKLLASKT